MRRALAPIALLALLALETGCQAGAVTTGASPAPAPLPSGATATLGVGGCEATAALASGALVGRYRSATGACVAARQLSSLRCSPGTLPVMIRGTNGRISVFLGGTFAVPVAEVPATAALIGVSATDRVWWERGTLWVEPASGPPARWPAVPGQPRAIHRPLEVWMIGDSILDAAQLDVTELLPAWSVTVDAEVGRGAGGGVAAAAAAAAARPEAVVIELGTNDPSVSAFRSAADAILASLAAVSLVVWVVPRASTGGPGLVAEQLREAVAAWPNATTADWSAAAPPDAFASDGIHVLPERQRDVAAFLAGTPAAWLTAVRGHGPVACVPELLRAARAS